MLSSNEYVELYRVDNELNILPYAILLIHMEYSNISCSSRSLPFFCLFENFITKNQLTTWYEFNSCDHMRVPRTTNSHFSSLLSDVRESPEMDVAMYQSVYAPPTTKTSIKDTLILANEFMMHRNISMKLKISNGLWFK